MADNIVEISLLSTLKWVREGYTRPAPYNTAFPEDHIYQETVPSFYEQQDFKQPYQKNDIIFLQILSNYAPHQVEMYDCNGNQVSGGIFVMSYIATSIEGTGLKVYEASIALDDFDEGVYYFKLKSGDPVLDTLRSEWIDLRIKHPNTVLLKYKHDENDLDVVFETGIEFSLRVPGGFPPEQVQPGGERVVFVDQPNNIRQLSGKAFMTEKFILGDTYGVPAWLVQKFNRILDCNTVLFDGKQYVANEGAKLEPNTEELYPLAGWVIELRPADPGNKKRFVADGVQGSPSSVVYNIQSRGFGSITQETSSNIIQVESLD